MAQLVNIFSEAGAGTVTAKLLNASTGSDVATAGSVTRRGSVWYECSFSGVAVGDYIAVVYDDAVPMVAKGVHIDAANGIWGDTVNLGIDEEILKIPRMPAAIDGGDQFKMVSPSQDVLVTYEAP